MQWGQPILGRQAGKWAKGCISCRFPRCNFSSLGTALPQISGEGLSMRTRAAVAVAPGKPLEIMDVNLDDPKEGEVLVEIKATGICHTDEFTLSGADPEGLFPDGTTRFSMLDGTPIYHYMGCSTFANHTVMPEIALAKVRDDAPFDKICYIGCGVTTGIGAVLNTAQVEIGAKAVVFGLGGIGLNVIQGLKMARADMIIGVDLNNDKKVWGEKFGMTHFINPKEIEGSVVQAIVDLTKTPFDKIGGADYSFDCTGNVKVMRDALECTHRGWGQSIIIGVAPAGAVIETRPFQLVTGRVWKGTAFGGARGRTDVPKIVDWYMEGKVEIDSMITHILKLEDINKGFDLMHSGESIRSVVVF